MTYWSVLLVLIWSVENLTSLMMACLAQSHDPIPDSQVGCILQVGSEHLSHRQSASLELISPALVVALAVVVVGLLS